MIWEMFQHAGEYLCLFTGAAYCSLLDIYKKNVKIVVVLYLFILNVQNIMQSHPVILVVNFLIPSIGTNASWQLEEFY